MFGKQWAASPRRYGIVRESHVEIPVSAGFSLDAEVFRPDAPGRFPVLLGAHPYSQADQTAALMPEGQSARRGHIEMGDYNFYVRRGYAQVVLNLRGTGRSGGEFDHLGPGTVRDVYDAIEWLSSQPWSDGNVGMLGLSYFSIVQKRVAELRPPSLKTVFCPYGVTDLYRDWHHHGGILAHGQVSRWINKLHRPRIDPQFCEKILSAEEYRRRLAAARQNDDLMAVPAFAQVLRSPEEGRNQILLAIMLSGAGDSFFSERALAADAAIDLPAYLGSCWGIYGLHLPGDQRSWEQFSGPRRLTIGPPVYLDRPFYQYQSESLRWFDHWLKGNDTGMMDEPPVQVFIDGAGRWRSGSEWPLPETRWEPFYLHERGLLSEHEPWAGEGSTSFFDSPFERQAIDFRTPPMVEETEICGPMVLNLFASTTACEVLWFVSVWEVDADGRERMLTRGWLKGSHWRLDADRSKPWLPYHSHSVEQPLESEQTYEFSVAILPYGLLLKQGCRLQLRISCGEEEQPANSLHALATGHVLSQGASRVTVHHDPEHASHLLLPIVSGNRLGTFMSGGVIA